MGETVGSFELVMKTSEFSNVEWKEWNMYYSTTITTTNQIVRNEQEQVLSHLKITNL